MIEVSERHTIQMTTPVVPSTAMVPRVPSAEINAPVTQAYCTQTSFVALHFDQAGKGKILFLPKGAILRPCWPVFLPARGFRSYVRGPLYNVFEIDLLTRSLPIGDAVRARGRAVEACG
jgi:hypothetical protein